MTRKLFAEIVAGVRATPLATDPTPPACPLCSAPAIAGYALTSWSDIAHSCACDLEHETAYLSGLRRSWARVNALPHYRATLPERYRDYTLDTLRPTEGNREALDAVRAGLTGNLYLYGPAGTGKSHLACAVAADLAAQRRTARFWGMAALFKALRESFSGDAPRPELHHWDVLVLDDIDKLKPSQFVYETFYEVVEARWAARKLTVFTAQSSPDEAALALTPTGNERAADPLASRMASGLVFHVQGQDGRFQGGAL